MRALHRMIWIGLLVLGLSGSLPAEASPNADDNPLIDAVTRADATAVRALLGAGADVNATASDGGTPLHWAVHRNDPTLVDLLLDAGADVAAANRYGVQPISLAAENGNAAILERLLEAGADPNTPLPGGETALMTASRGGDTDAIRVLLVNGADPNAKEGLRGQTALMWAAARNNATAIHILAELGGDIGARTNNPPQRRGSTFASPPSTGFTPLLFAVRSGHIDAVRALLEVGADVNDPLSDGQSALVVAAANAHWELADYLLDRGADPTLAGAGWNALHQTIRTRRMSLTFGTPPPTPSGNVDSIDVVKKLLAQGVNVNARMTKNGMRDGQRNRQNRLGATAFFLAAKVTDVEAMRVLLEAGADPLISTAEGTTPLMGASGLALWNPGEDGGSLTGQEGEVLEAVTICLELGNDINAVNYRGETALHGAAYRGANIIVEYLVEQGATLDARTDEGWTALAIADGLSYSDFYKAQKHTAELLASLMEAQGLPTEGEVIGASVCFDCLQTRRDEVASREAWVSELEEEFAEHHDAAGVPLP